jgi:hypothetical protein
MKKEIILSIGLLLGAGNGAQAMSLQFDYSYDHGGFFASQERRFALEYAASFYTGFSDRLSAINPGNGNTWQARFKNPSPGYDQYAFYTVDNLSIQADSVTIFVGASNAVGFSALGQASSMAVKTASGSEQFITDLNSRGQGLTSGDGAVDFGALGGSIWFNAAHDWYFGLDRAGLSGGHPDFLTTATHEIGHILGYGTADSWHNLIGVDELFYGPAAMAVYGGPVPTDGSSHWAEGVMSLYNGIPQETMMDPSTPYGERQLPTLLDMAGFKDIGWQTSEVPLPPSLFLLLSGLAPFFIKRYRCHSF